VKVVFWHVLDDGADGIALLDTLFNRYGGHAEFVVVKNYGRGKDFSAYGASPVRVRAEELGAREIELPGLHPATMRKIDHGSTSLWAAANSSASGLGLMDRQRVKVWTQRVYKQFGQFADTHFTLVADALMEGVTAS